MRLIAHGLVAISLVALACVLGTGGCSNQSEGDQCSTANGNDDCQDGLACVSGAPFNSNYDRCCPPDPTQVTTQACTPPTTLPLGDSGSPDTSTVDSSAVDSSTLDTSVVDSSVVDTSTPVDAPVEGG
jgi:hypothetical protein